mgnify:CR=1 FL=1
MPKCTNCDGHITEQFARVFGDNQDRVHTCMGCGSNAELGSRPRQPSPEPPEPWVPRDDS